MYAHYMINTQEFNPAYVGSRQSMSVISLNRSHWALVFDKAPISQSLNIHTPLLNENMGLGVSFRNESFGPERTTSFFSDFSYRIRLTPESTLSFGLKAGVGFYNVPLTQLVIDDTRDPAFASDIDNHWLPNFGFGLYYRKENMYIGASIPKFLEVNYFDRSFIGGARTVIQERNYFLIAGAVFHINNYIDLVPSTYVRFQRESLVEADVSATFILFDRFSAGAMLRLQDAMGILLGIWINESWSVGYSFDWSILNRTPSFNFGSHELVLRYDLEFLDTHRSRGPRYF